MGGTVEFRDRIKELRRIPASELRANPKNWRTHPKAQHDAVRGVLNEIGYADALLARVEKDGSLVLIDGHLRAEITPEATVPVLILDVTEEEGDKILATLDPLAAMAKSDAGKLDALLREVDTGSEALQAMLAELAKNAGLYKTPEVVEDEVPEPPAAPITKVGDLWLLGRHRLLCGDSTNAAAINRLMEGQRANCIFTDPPYGVAIGAKNRFLNSFQKAGRNLTDITDDALTPEQLEDRLLPAFANIKDLVMADDCTLFVSAPLEGGELGMMMMMRRAGLAARHVLIWKKNQPTFSMGRLDYDYAHEPILLTWCKKHKRPMNGPHKTSVWEIDRERKCDAHPTMKPVALYANAYLNNSDEGDLVFDAYAGSGTAFIAAEQLKRRCYAIELSPAYCDVIVDRWQKLTGGKATREKSRGQVARPKPLTKPKKAATAATSAPRTTAAGRSAKCRTATKNATRGRTGGDVAKRNIGKRKRAA